MVDRKQSRKKPPGPAGQELEGSRREEGFPNPFNHRQILAYYRQLHFWHGFIRFLGLPHLKDNPDVPIDRLFVPPELTEQPLPPDPPREGGSQRRNLVATLAHYPRLVVLGEPGSGKSTLVSWVAWALSRSSKGPWVEALGLRVPMPMVVRELELEPELGWEGLLDAFLNRPVAEDLDRRLAQELLDRGQAFVLLDGVDEIASVARRQALRSAVIEGVERYPECRWLVTSRQVGYDRVPFHLFPEAWEAEVGAAPPEDELQGLEGFLEPPELVRRWAVPVYVAPFSDRQIERFAHNWYHRYEPSSKEGERKARDLLEAIQGNHRTLRLARVPNLLTLMALIHRIQARLPHGRSVLYGKIVEAYLESIDAYRGLHEVDYSLEEKKRWLAWVGFRMQRRRSEEAQDREEPGTREILVDENEVVAWLEEAMALSPRAVDVAEPGTAARVFVDYIARRSGLLLPRGQGRYAFTHLSFQEFFAALHLEERITSPRWFGKGSTEAGDGPEDLRGYADQDAWREPLVLLFGLLAGRPEWSEELVELLFGEGFSGILEDEGTERVVLARLLAEVSTDPHTGLTGNLRQYAWDACWLWELRRQAKSRFESFYGDVPVITQTLLSVESGEVGAVLESFKTAGQRIHLRLLTLRDSRAFRGFGALTGFESLEGLDLSGTGVSDLSSLEEFQGLEFLRLSGTGISDLRPLEELSKLYYLNLSGTGILDLRPLAELHHLRILDLSSTRVSDVGPLAGLHNLRHLSLSDTGISDLGPLEGLRKLRNLFLSGTAISDLRPLEGLQNLEFLFLSDMGVLDLRPLGELQNLRRLFLTSTGVSDLRFLEGLQNLELLDLSGTEVSDLKPLKGLQNLKFLDLSRTEVSDLRPLQGLKNLESLQLSATRVSDVAPLASIEGLRIVGGPMLSSARRHTPSRARPPAAGS